MAQGSVYVLAYHAVADLSADPILAPYGVTPAELAMQLDQLVQRGHTFVDLETVIDALSDGSGASHQGPPCSRSTTPTPTWRRRSAKCSRRAEFLPSSSLSPARSVERTAGTGIWERGRCRCWTPTSFET